MSVRVRGAGNLVVLGNGNVVAHGRGRRVKVSASVTSRRTPAAPPSSFSAYVQNAEAQEAAWRSEEAERRARAAQAAGKSQAKVAAARFGVEVEDDGGAVVVRIGGRGFDLLRRAAAACSRAFPGNELDAGDVAARYGIVQASALADGYTLGRHVLAAATAKLGGLAGSMSARSRELVHDLEVELMVEGLRDPAEVKDIDEEAL